MSHYIVPGSLALDAPDGSILRADFSCTSSDSAVSPRTILRPLRELFNQTTISTAHCDSLLHLTHSVLPLAARPKKRLVVYASHPRRRRTCLNYLARYTHRVASPTIDLWLLRTIAVSFRCEICARRQEQGHDGFRDESAPISSFTHAKGWSAFATSDCSAQPKKQTALACCRHCWASAGLIT